MTATTRRAGTAAARVVATLEQLGVDVVFGLPGVHNLPLWSALEQSPIDLVGVRHEQTAVYAADGLARTSGRLGVAFATSGPGAANTLAATGEAWSCGSPVMIIATDIPAALRRPGAYRGVLHENRDQAGMFAPLVKRTFRISDPELVVATIVDAAHTALSAPSGPVYLEIPTDLLSLPAAAGPVRVPPYERRPAGDAELTSAAEILDRAQRPLLWVGGGATRSEAGAAVEAVAERLGAPVIETYAARGLVSPTHPGHVGLAPHFPSVGALWDEADAVLAVGSDFDGMMTQNWAMPPPTALVSINVSLDDATKAYPPDVCLVGDARAVLEQLHDRLRGDRDPAQQQRRMRQLEQRVQADLSGEDAQGLALIADLKASVPASTPIAADMCIAGYWIAAARQFDGPRRLAYPVGWGTLGFAFPASIGIAIAHAAPTLCVCGDGGFLFAAGELAVLAEREPPLTVLIVNDQGYGMLRYDQAAAGEPAFGVDLATPDFVALAQSFGIFAERVDTLGKPLRAALRAQLERPGPSVLVLDAALQPPPTTTARWYRGS